MDTTYGNIIAIHSIGTAYGYFFCLFQPVAIIYMLAVALRSPVCFTATKSSSNKICTRRVIRTSARFKV